MSPLNPPNVDIHKNLSTLSKPPSELERYPKHFVIYVRNHHQKQIKRWYGEEPRRVQEKTRHDPPSISIVYLGEVHPKSQPMPFFRSLKLPQNGGSTLLCFASDATEGLAPLSRPRAISRAFQGDERSRVPSHSEVRVPWLAKTYPMRESPGKPLGG